jgi:hypothetical protein
MIIDKVPVLLLLLCFILFFSICLNTGFGADPDFPRWQVGNWWKFNIESSGEVNLVGTSTYTVVSDDVDVHQNGQDFNCYQIDVLGGGTIYGNGIGGKWTLTGRYYYLKSDQSWVAIHSTYEDTVSIDDASDVTPISFIADETLTMKIVIDTTYNPPFEANKGFPLTVGKSWSVATTETSKTQTMVNGDTESTTESEACTKTFLVLRKKSITISTDEIETYVIKRTDSDGAYAEAHYSPEVGFDVKMIEYDSTGTLQTTMELLNYEYKPIGGDSHLLTTGIFPILIIVSIIVISAIAIIYLLKKKKSFQTLKSDNLSESIRHHPQTPPFSLFENKR